MAYVDGFVAAVPTENKQAYIDFAQATGPIFKDHGALAVVDCWGDDVPDGEVTSFPMAVKAQEGETVVFSWVLWPDKAARNAGMEKVLADPRMEKDAQGPIPFDGKRLIYAGFEMVSEI